MWPTYNVRACLRKKKALVFADLSDLRFPWAPSQGAACGTRQPCPLGLDWAHFTVPLNQVSCTTHGGEIPAMLPLKVKSQHFYFLLDKARHPNTQFFDNPWVSTRACEKTTWVPSFSQVRMRTLGMGWQPEQWWNLGASQSSKGKTTARTCWRSLFSV